MSSEKGLKYIYTQEYKLSLLLAVFILEDALFGQTFVVRLVIRLQYKDGHRTHYPLIKSHNRGLFVWTDVSCVRRMTNVCPSSS